MTTRHAASMCMFSIVVAAYASTAGAAVYKCTEPGGQVLYSDIPCKGGAVVDVRAGEADPGAIDRLERERVEFERNMSLRRAADEAAAIRREALNAQLREAEAAQRMAEAAANSAPQYYVPAFGFVAPRLKRHAHSHKVTRAPRHNVPASPVPLPGRRWNP